MPDVCAVLISALNDGEEKIRKISLGVVCENFKLLQQSGDANILKEAGKRIRDKKVGIRKEAMQLFASIYQKAPAKERESCFGWIVNMVLGNARDTDSSDVRGEVDSILDEKFLPETSSPSAVFSSVTALLAHLDDAGFAGLEHLLNNKARIASELRRACLMVCQSGSDPSLLASCVKNLASFLPESLKAADQLEAVFAYSSIKIAPKLLECLDVVHDSSELRKRKRDLDKKFGPRSSLQDFLDELFIHFQIGLFDCRWVQGLLLSVSTHDISVSAMKLTKVVLTLFPKTASACNTIIFDCIQNDKNDSSIALRAVHANAENFRGNTKLINATLQLCTSRNRKIAKLASRAYVAIEGQSGADTLVRQMKDNLDVDEGCVAALSVLLQCAILFPLSIMRDGVNIGRFVVDKLASTSSIASSGGKTSKSAKAAASTCEWLSRGKVIGIKLLGVLACCVKDKPEVARFALNFFRDVINADGAVGSAETTDEFKAESRLECGKAILRIASCPDITANVSYADLHLIAGLIEDVESSVKKPFAKHLYKSLITRKTGATLPWRFAAIFALAANDSDRDFASQVLLLLKQTVAFMRTMYRRAASAGTVTAAHLLPERILPMVVHLIAHHPDFVAAKTSDSDRSSIAKKNIGSVMEALASGPE
jgi:sister-chromatid-cohesion protein PDS5